jgi:hypothetical protein
MTSVYVGAGLVAGLIVLLSLMARVGRKRAMADEQAASSKTAAACTIGVQLMIDELVDRHDLKLADVAAAARAAHAAYEKLDAVPGWPGKRLGRGQADGRSLLQGIQIYCAEQEAAGLKGGEARLSS